MTLFAVGFAVVLLVLGCLAHWAGRQIPDRPDDDW